MTKKSSKKYIVVDGVTYDIVSGRAINQNNNSISKRDTVLDLRTGSPRPSSALVTPVPSRQNTVRMPRHQSSIPKATNPPHLSKEPETDYLSFVIGTGLFAKNNTSLWQLCLARTLLSPQTWLILTLPLILLQLFLLRHYTINQSLSAIKDTLSPANYQAIIWSLGISLALFFLGVVARSTITAAGLFSRLREIDKREVTTKSAVRLAASRLWHQALNYIFHLAILGLATVTFLLSIKNIFQSSNVWILTIRYELIVLLVVIWAVVLIFLYGKHWLQVGLLALSKNPFHTQIESIRLVFTTPLTIIITSLTGLTLIALCYASIIFVDIQLVRSFLHQSNTPTFILLVLTAVMSIIFLTALQYIQQSLWAHQYYFTAQHSLHTKELLYHQIEKHISLWPLIMILVSLVVFFLIYIMIVVIFSAQINGMLANLHALIPSEIKLVVPLQR